jgi:hypothetical protein
VLTLYLGEFLPAPRVALDGTGDAGYALWEPYNRGRSYLKGCVTSEWFAETPHRAAFVARPTKPEPPTGPPTESEPHTGPFAGPAPNDPTAAVRRRP